MMCDNRNVDLVNINAYIEFGKILSICSQDMGGIELFAQIKVHISGTNERKITCIHP